MIGTFKYGLLQFTAVEPRYGLLRLMWPGLKSDDDSVIGHV